MSIPKRKISTVRVPVPYPRAVPIKKAGADARLRPTGFAEQYHLRGFCNGCYGVRVNSSRTVVSPKSVFGDGVTRYYCIIHVFICRGPGWRPGGACPQII